MRSANSGAATRSTHATKPLARASARRASTRAAISDSVFQLAAPRSDAAKNKTIVATKVRRWPKVSTSHAVASIDVVVAARKPVATHCNESWPMLNSRISAGNATLTMVAARMVETVATIVVATTHGRRRIAEGVAESCGAPGIGASSIRRGEALGEDGFHRQRPPGERERKVREGIPDPAAANTLGQRVEPGQAQQQARDRRCIDAPRRALQRRLALAPHADGADCGAG